MPRRTRQNGPLDFTTPLDAATVDLTAVATTQYSSGLIDVREYFVFTLVIDVLETGAPTVGAFKVTLNVLKKDKTSTLWSMDILTAIDSTTNATQEVLLFGAGVTAAITAASTGTLSADADVFKVAEYIELVLEVVTANDGTTSTADVHLLMEG